MKYLSNIILLAIVALVLQSCKTITYGQDPATIGELYGFRKVLVKGGDFWLTTYQKVTNKHKPYVFYKPSDEGREKFIKKHLKTLWQDRYK